MELKNLLSHVSNMSDLSLKERILRYIEGNTAHDPDLWIPKGQLEREAMHAGFLGDNCARRLRELHADGMILRRENEKGHVEYRYDSMAKKLRDVGLV